MICPVIIIVLKLYGFVGFPLKEADEYFSLYGLIILGLILYM
jgi:hypothetical protein